MIICEGTTTLGDKEHNTLHQRQMHHLRCFLEDQKARKEKRNFPVPRGFCKNILTAHEMLDLTSGGSMHRRRWTFFSPNYTNMISVACCSNYGITRNHLKGGKLRRPGLRNGSLQYRGRGAEHRGVGEGKTFKPNTTRHIECRTN